MQSMKDKLEAYRLACLEIKLITDEITKFNKVQDMG